jgi:hypothetical protein
LVWLRDLFHFCLPSELEYTLSAIKTKGWQEQVRTSTTEKRFIPLNTCQLPEENRLMIVVENGPDRFVCAGPVLSHYEIAVLGDPHRLTDEEWRGVLANHFPSDVDLGRIEGLSPPLWTRSYLVPAQ